MQNCIRSGAAIIAMTAMSLAVFAAPAGAKGLSVGTSIGAGVGATVANGASIGAGAGIGSGAGIGAGGGIGAGASAGASSTGGTDATVNSGGQIDVSSSPNFQGGGSLPSGFDRLSIEGNGNADIRAHYKILKSQF